MDLGPGVVSFSPPLRSSLTVPLVREKNLIAVISLYGSTPDAFTDDHARLLTLLAPSLATSLAALPPAQSRVPGQEARRAAVGELRLLRR